MKVKIREYESKDSNSIKELYSQFVQYHSKFDDRFIKVKGHEGLFLNYIESNTHNESFNCAVAEIDGKVIGYCVSKIEEKPPVYPNPTFGNIDNLCISEGYQRRGVGLKLVQHAITWFNSKSIDKIECFVALKNPKSTSFWRKIGFQPVTEQLCYNI